MAGKINRCIGWEIYRSLHNIPFDQHLITDDYTKILDGTDDIDYPHDYENFKRKIECGVDRISVIIPCYNNAENTKYLIDKLLKQKKSYPETEIIVIENGSTEDMFFLDQYKQNQIIVKHEQLTGASHARNVGLNLASGEFICFIDNDDDITDDYLHELYRTMRANNHKADFCVIISYSDNNLIHDYSTVDLTNPIKQIWSVWQYCYNRRIIKNIRFNEQKIVAEDIDWLRRVLPENIKHPNGTISKKPLYFYKWTNNENSLSHRYNRGEIHVWKEST